MAAADVLFNASTIKGNRLHDAPMTNQRRLELRMPDHGIIGQRPRELDQFRLDKTYSHANLGLSSATTYQSIHVPQSRSVHAVLPTNYKYQPTSVRNRLPNLFQRTSSRKFKKPPHWRSSVPSTSVLYATPSQTNENTIPLRPHTSAGRIIAYTSGPINWNSAQPTMSATGQSLLSDSYKNRTYYKAALTTRNNLPNTHLPHHTLVNYVPFYEPRTRGDGASEVDAPTTGKKSNKTPSPENDGNTMKEAIATAKREIVDRRAPSALKNSRPESPEWPGANGRQSALHGRQEKKRDRFSSAVTDKMEEPAYVETLLNSVSKRLQTGVKEGWAVPAEEGEKNPTVKPNAIHDATSTVDDDEDPENFATPITRVTVTRRKVGEEKPMSIHGTSATSSNANLHAQQQQSQPKNVSQQKVQEMATKILNNGAASSSAAKTETRDAERTETISPSRSPARNATGFMTARVARKGEIVPMSKYVQKKQAVITPSFPEQPAKTRNTFMSYATRLTRNESIRKGAQKGEPNPSYPSKEPTITNPGRRDTGISYRQTAPASGQSSKRLVQYISIDLKINNLAHSNTAVAPSMEPPRSSTSFLPAQATHFQPIPSMPDHINFCDPGKTEHILEWLDDVNRKRNIDMKLKRVSSSMSSKTIS